MRLRTFILIGFCILSLGLMHQGHVGDTSKYILIAKTTDYQKPPKQDRIHLAMQQEFDMTRDPSLNEVPIERLLGIRHALRNSGPRRSMAGEMQWEERGPINVGGRTRAILMDKNDPTGNTVFAGSVSGGLWKTTQIHSSNPQWQDMNDQLDHLAISSIAQDPTNPQIIYIGTGEGYFNSTGMQGFGIWKSTNGGTSWSHLSSTNNSAFKYIQRLVIDNSGNIFACTYHAGVQKSTNGGASWQKVLGQSKYGSSNRASDIEMAANGTLYASLGLHAKDGIYRSTNGGASWTKLTNGLPSNNYHRIEIAVAPSNSNVLYAAFQDSATDECKGIYKSSNGGTSWSAVSNPSAYGMSNFARNQAWYNLEIAVDPNNANRIFLGGIDLHLSTNGGTSWTQLAQWSGSGGFSYMHADQHVIKFHQTDSNKVLVGNDGGVWYSSNAGSSNPNFSHRNIGYNVTQFYSCDAKPGNGINYFLAGAQDNGNQKFTSAGMNNTSDVSGGDGGIVHIDQDNPNIQIVALIYNNYMISYNGGSNFFLRSFNDLGRFINPSDYDDNLNKLYAADQAGKYLRWNDPTLGGANAQVVTVSGMSDVISFVKVSPNISGRVYFGLGNGDVYRIDGADSGTFKTGTKIRQGTGAYLSSIDIEKDNEDHLIISYSNYGVTSIYETTNGGNNWMAVEGNVPDMPVRSVVFNPNHSDQALIGTETGVWATENLNGNNTIWSPINNSIPIVRTDMLKFRTSDNLLMAATHGRGLFTTEYFDQVSISADATSFNFQEQHDGTITGSCPKDYKDYLIPVNINKAPSSTINMTVSAGSGTANNGSDYQIQTPSINFNAGSTSSKNIILRVYDDAIDESDETLVLLLNSSSAQIETPQINVSIKSNDTDPSAGGSSLEYQVGQDQISVSQYPLRGFYEDQRTQMIFHASELLAQGMTAGPITSISFQILDKNSTAAFNNFQVSMAHTNLQNTNQVGDGFEGNMSTVYLTNQVTKAGWNKLNFNQAFQWNGSSNIILQFCFNNNFWSLDDAVAATETLFNSVQHRYADSQVGCQLSTVQSISKNRPNIRFYSENQTMASLIVDEKASPMNSQKKNHYYDLQGNVIMSVEMLNGQSVSCAKASTTSIGSGLLFPGWLSGSAISGKSFYLDINSTSSYEITLYFNESELQAWPELDDLRVIKTQGPVPSASNFTALYFGEDLLHLELPNGLHAFRFTSSGDGGFALTNFNSSTVPVELMSFDVKKLEHSNLLDWTVVNEIAIDAYQVERSFNGTYFEEIGSVKAIQDQSMEEKTYQFRDDDLKLKNKTYFYRLGINESDGSTRYSDIRSVYIKGRESNLIVYPNPARRFVNLSVELDEDEKLDIIKLMNMKGQEILHISPERGIGEYQLSLEDVPAGIYMINLYTSFGQLLSQKISLVK